MCAGYQIPEESVTPAHVLGAVGSEQPLRGYYVRCKVTQNHKDERFPVHTFASIQDVA